MFLQRLLCFPNFLFEHIKTPLGSSLYAHLNVTRRERDGERERWGSNRTRLFGWTSQIVDSNMVMVWLCLPQKKKKKNSNFKLRGFPWLWMSKTSVGCGWKQEGSENFSHLKATVLVVQPMIRTSSSYDVLTDEVIISFTSLSVPWMYYIIQAKMNHTNSLWRSWKKNAKSWFISFHH